MSETNVEVHLQDRCREDRARAVEAMAMQMVFGDEKQIVIASPSKQEAESLFNAAKHRASELMSYGHSSEGNENERRK